MLHEDFLDLISGPIGRVVTSEESPATAHEFFFWTAETEAAQKLDRTVRGETRSRLDNTINKCAEMGRFLHT